ncbi:MAG: hypothetical protein ACM3RX_04370, partial [Methanococcaceae archaeon]
MKKIIIPGLIFILFFLSCRQQNLQYTSKVKDYQGKPVLYINDTINYPLINSLVGEVGARLSYDEYPAWNIKRFADAG